MAIYGSDLTFKRPTKAQVPADVSAINDLLTNQRTSLQEADSTIYGFNIGMNCGETAGQTIFHCHVHLIPRRKGDVENPRVVCVTSLLEKAFTKISGN